MKLQAPLTLFTLSLVLISCDIRGSSPGQLRGGQGSGREVPRTEAQVAHERNPTEIRRDGNQLLNEPSPYLRQHAHNPVNWYPWGEEALSLARELDRPIFLSIGYSTCHWCHVMEEESFENDEVAAYLNRHFVSIKVDREQRPDIDSLYIDAVGAMGGSTGWPLTVFLTPQLEPFFGGTYFPPESRYGRPSFMEVLAQVETQYREQGETAGQRGRAIFQRILRRARELGSAEQAIDPGVVDRAMSRLNRARDMTHGGFGSRQKFPNTPLLLAELRHVIRTGNAPIRRHLERTLEEAMRGGIRDHLGGAFHRYATDIRWHLPHFEKTLYDNAQLAQLYVEAGLFFERPEFVAVGQGVLDELLATWQQEDGGLVVGFDADDPAGEGAFYSWTPAELSAVLGAQDGERIAALFGVGNTGDHGLNGRSVLHRLAPTDAVQRLGISPATIDALWTTALPRLREVRDRRPPPAIDDKELTAWNGLALMAFANVGRWLNEPRYIAAARRIADFILSQCMQPDGVMLRGRRAGQPLGEGFVDDYALPVLGLLRLAAADSSLRWLEEARRLTRLMVTRFYDASLSAFMHTARTDVPSGLPLRRPDLDDGVLPSGGTAAILALIEMGALAGDSALHRQGMRALQAAAPRATMSTFSSGFLLVALDHALGQSREVVVAGDPASSDTRALWDVIRTTTFADVLPIQVPAEGYANAAFPALREKVASGGRATAYVCEIGRCERPTSDPETLRSQLPSVSANPQNTR